MKLFVALGAPGKRLFRVKEIEGSKWSGSLCSTQLEFS